MRRFILLFALSLVASVAAPAWATTARTPISGSQQAVALLEPGTSWDSGPIHHVRGERILSIQSFDDSVGLPDAEVLATINFNVDTRSFMGRAWGSAVVDFGDGGFRTTFQGSLRPAPVPGGGLGTFEIVGQGFGTFEGTQIRATSQEFVVVGFGTFEGVLITPGRS